MSDYDDWDEGSLFVACPKCKARIDDPWDFRVKDGRWEEIDCPKCEQPIFLKCEVSYSYRVSIDNPDAREGR